MSMRYFVEADRTSVTLGSVVAADPALPPLEAHIFLEDKAPYFVIADDGAQRFDRFPQGFEGKLAQWRATKDKE